MYICPEQNKQHHENHTRNNLSSAKQARVRHHQREQPRGPIQAPGYYPIDRMAHGAVKKQVRAHGRVRRADHRQQFEGIFHRSARRDQRRNFII